MLFKKKKLKWILGVMFFVMCVIFFSFYYVAKNDWLFNEPYLTSVIYHYEYQGRISPDGSRFAYVEKKSNGKMVVILDEERQKKEYDAVRKLSFSPDSSNFSYFAERNNDQFIVLNGEELKNHTDIFFAPNSKRIAYIVKDGDKKFVKVDNADNKGEKYDSINDFIFSEDGSSFAYKAMITEEGDSFAHEGRGGITWERVVVLSNEEWGGYYEIGNLALSPDGSRFAYEAKNNINDNWFVVLDGKKLEEIGEERYHIRRMRFNDNNDFIYEGTLPSTSSTPVADILFFNGEKIANYDGIRDVIFSPNGESFAYIARKGNLKDPPQSIENLIILNGEEQESYNYISEHIFGPQDAHFYLARKDEDCFIISGNEKNIISEKGIREGIWQTRCDIENLTISNNEERVAYKRTKYPITLYNFLSPFFKTLPEEVYYVILDNKFHETYKYIDNMSFDKDGENFVYRASDGSDWFVVLNGEELEKHKFIVGPVFNFNGNILSYVAIDDKIKKIDINLKK